MFKVTKEDAERDEHLPNCAGYDDCECFSTRVNYSDLYEMQQHNEYLQDELLRLHRRIADLRTTMKAAVVNLQVKSMAQSGELATRFEVEGI